MLNQPALHQGMGLSGRHDIGRLPCSLGMMCHPHHSKRQINMQQAPQSCKNSKLQNLGALDQEIKINDQAKEMMKSG